MASSSVKHFKDAALRPFWWKFIGSRLTLERICCGSSKNRSVVDPCRLFSNYTTSKAPFSLNIVPSTAHITGDFRQICSNFSSSSTTFHENRKSAFSSKSRASDPAVEMKLSRLDHVVLTVADIEATCRFYTRVLGMGVVTFGEGRKALAFGEQKINLHQVGKEIEPKGHRPTPGSADLCFVTDVPLDDAKSHVEGLGVEIIQGPVMRTGAVGRIRSIYFRDPDLNLLEVSNYV